MLNQWDSGGTFFTIDCGGMGPGYEQALQVAAVEFARAQHKKPMLITGDQKKDYEAWDKKCTNTLSSIDDSLLGLSGAQFGAAKWLSWNWCFKGGIKALTERAKADGQDKRVIQVSKSWPHIP